MKTILSLIIVILLSGCVTKSKEPNGKNISPTELNTIYSNFKVMALEMIIKEKQAIDSEEARRARSRDKWNDLDDPEEPQKGYLFMWSSYFKDFKNPDKQWCYGLRSGEEEALIDFIIIKRRALGLAEIKR
jgi:hypothetical protein